ncbi:MAG: extracellular solute-binding protein [Clostridia bacterium]|nr:extracellular solute-binding protein [Clostridia bacterium]
MRKPKKSIVAALAAGLLAGALCGCSGVSENVAGEENLKLSWWTINHQPAYISNYNEVAAFRQMQEKTGVEIAFLHPAAGQETEQFNVMISSKDYPDIIDWQWETEYPGGMNKAVSDGVIIKLDDYMQYAPNYEKLLEQQPEFRNSVKTTDGAILTFNQLKDDVGINSYFGPCIRKDWLDKLDLAVPQTIDDWYNVLKAFKTMDPNGNGNIDEIPLLDSREGGLQYLSVAWGTLKGMFFEKDGKMVYGSVQPEYKDFLQTMHDWYAEGLIDAEFASSSRTNIDAKMLGGTAGAFVGYMGSQMGNYLAQQPEMNLVGAPWPKGASGISYIGMPEMLKTAIPGYGSAISTANSHVKETMALLDYNYSEEGIIAQNWGVEGVTFERKGAQFQFLDSVLHDKGGKNPIEAMSPYTLTTWGGYGKVMNGAAYTALMQTYDQQKEASKIWTQGDTSLLLPAFPFTAEESLHISNIMTEARLYENEMYIKMIMGIEPISGFEEYVARMEAIGVNEAARLYEIAYSRYKAQQ